MAMRINYKKTFIAKPLMVSTMVVGLSWYRISIVYKHLVVSTIAVSVELS